MLSDISTATQAVLAAVAPSVVAVGRDGRGTGFVVAPNRVLTNAHNLRDATTLVTFADGRAVQGTLHGADRAGDLAVLDVDTGSIAPLTWAEESPGVGDVVFAVSRGGHRARITFGILSAVGAPFSGPRGRIVQAGIEHTAPLPRGSSGGPLTNAQGAVLGVNTHRIGEGFYVARPFDQALRARVVELIEGRTVEPRALGVALAPADVAAKLRRSGGLTGGPPFSIQLRRSRCLSRSMVHAISTRPVGIESAPNFVVLVQSSLNVIASAMTAPEVIRRSGPLK